MRSQVLLLTTICIFIAYVISVVLALILGDENLSFTQIYQAILGKDELLGVIVFDLRMPRIIMAILIGMLLASSGAITQTVFSNPIADPYIIGIAISSFLGAFTSFFIYYIGENSFKVMAWLMGYLGLASWDKVLILLAPLLFCLAFFYAHKNALNIILSGDEEAKNLGIDAVKLKRKLLIVSSLAVSFGVAFSGLIGFVGLIVPHIIRMMIKNYDNALVLPLCTLLGGIFLLLCDTLARVLLSPVEIPIGIITSLFGAPVFLFLALKARRIL